MVTYAKLEDDFPEHRKIVGLSDSAFRLYVTALCYSSRNLTDGFVAAAIIQRLGGKSKTTAELTTADLWHGEAGPVAGWRIHDYLKHQRSRETVLQQRADAVERAKKSKRNAAEVAPQPKRNPSRQSTELEGEGSSNELAAAAAREKAPPDDLHRRAYNAWDTQAPGGLLRPIIQHLDDELEAGTPVEWIELACESAAENGGRKPWKYVKATIDRYRRDGPGDRPQQQPQDSTSAFMSGLIKKGA